MLHFFHLLLFNKFFEYFGFVLGTNFFIFEKILFKDVNLLLKFNIFKIMTRLIIKSLKWKLIRIRHLMSCWLWDFNWLSNFKLYVFRFAQWNLWTSWMKVTKICYRVGTFHYIFYIIKLIKDIKWIKLSIRAFFFDLDFLKKIFVYLKSVQKIFIFWRNECSLNWTLESRS